MHPFEQTPLILVVADVEETRMGIERLLSADRYRVLAVRDSAHLAGPSGISPDLVLMTLGNDQLDPVALARQVRDAWNLADRVPIIIFALATLEEGAEVKVEPSLYLTHPDNFNQLRNLISRLVRSPEGSH
jgi:CheY-like chemotaxis protein